MVLHPGGWGTESDARVILGRVHLDEPGAPLLARCGARPPGISLLGRKQRMPLLSACKWVRIVNEGGCDDQSRRPDLRRSFRFPLYQSFGVSCASRWPGEEISNRQRVARVAPGDYVIEKRTHRGAHAAKQGVEYRKTVLLGATKEGAPSFSHTQPTSRKVPGQHTRRESVDRCYPDTQRESQELARQRSVWRDQFPVQSRPEQSSPTTGKGKSDAVDRQKSGLEFRRENL